jgi:integrase/recombinase XerC
MTTALTRYDATLQARAGRWVDLAPDDRRRKATAAAQMKDTADLWSLLEAYLATDGAAGAKLSPHTLRSYRGGLSAYLAYAGTPAAALGPATLARWRAVLVCFSGSVVT